MTLLPGKCAVVTPWVRESQRAAFAEAWTLSEPLPDWMILQHDSDGDGCGVTKNNGVRRATELGAEVVVVLDDDCFPSAEAATLPELAAAHLAALSPCQVEMFEAVTSPPSRGTPYSETALTMPVAASMGFWTEVGDYCAVRSLAHRDGPMTFLRRPVFGRYFPLCGMNVAFRPREWSPWCLFVNVPRFDDIWMGWLWQREAYRRGCCFNLAGPLVRHSRQSNVWNNLREEAKFLERSETLWRDVATSPLSSYEDLRSILPKGDRDA